ncbi:MAG: signal peptidase I [Nitrospirae bacterium]|nr:MAG: signal peptidase I [Nitrospirota bacterium]
MITSKDISELLLTDGFDVRMHAAGASMFPVISSGDRIIVSREREYAAGDIVVFRRNDILVCHRIIKIYETDGIRYFRTRGDSFLSPDEPVPAGQVLGRVVRIDKESTSLRRKVLLWLSPALHFGRLNAFVVSALVSITNLFAVPHKTRSLLK